MQSQHCSSKYIGEVCTLQACARNFLTHAHHLQDGEKPGCDWIGVNHYSRCLHPPPTPCTRDIEGSAFAPALLQNPINRSSDLLQVPLWHTLLPKISPLPR